MEAGLERRTARVAARATELSAGGCAEGWAGRLEGSRDRAVRNDGAGCGGAGTGRGGAGCCDLGCTAGAGDGTGCEVGTGGGGGVGGRVDRSADCREGEREVETGRGSGGDATTGNSLRERGRGGDAKGGGAESESSAGGTESVSRRKCSGSDGGWSRRVYRGGGSAIAEGSGLCDGDGSASASAGERRECLAFHGGDQRGMCSAVPCLCSDGCAF